MAYDCTDEAAKIYGRLVWILTPYYYMHNEQPPREQPVSEQPSREQPVSEQPVSEQPSREQPVREQPVSDRAQSNEANCNLLKNILYLNKQANLSGNKYCCGSRIWDKEL